MFGPGTINELSYKLGEEQLTAAGREHLQRMVAVAQDTPTQKA